MAVRIPLRGVHTPTRPHSGPLDPGAEDLARRRSRFLRRRRLARLRTSATAAGWVAGSGLLALLTLGGVAGLIGLR